MGFRNCPSCTGGLLLNPFVSTHMHENEKGWGRSASHANSVKQLLGFMFIALIPLLLTAGDSPLGDAVSSTVPANLIVIWICFPCGPAVAVAERGACPCRSKNSETRELGRGMWFSVTSVLLR